MSTLTHGRVAPALLSAVVCLAVLGASVFTGSRIDSHFVPVLSAIVGSAFLAIVTLQDMRLALTLLVAISALVPTYIGPGIGPAFVMVALFSVVWLARMIVQDGRIRFMAAPFNLPLGLFLVAMLVSWLVGSIIWDPQVFRPSDIVIIQTAQYALFVLTAAALLLAANQRWSLRYLLVWNAAVIAIGYFQIGQELLFGRGRFATGIEGTLLIVPVVMVCAQLLLNEKLGPILRLLGLILVTVWVVWVVTRVFSWKGAWLPTLPAVVFLVSVRSRKLAFALVPVVLGYLWGSTFFAEALATEAASGSLLRPLLWWDVIRLSMHSPLFGLGPVSYEFYWSAPSFIPVSRTAANWAAWNQWGYSPPSHSLAVDLFAQGGLVAVVLFAAVVMIVLKLGWQAAQQQSENGFLRAYVYGVLASFIALLLSSVIMAEWLLPFVYNVGLEGFQHSVYAWLMLGTILSLRLHGLAETRS